MNHYTFRKPVRVKMANGRSVRVVAVNGTGNNATLQALEAENGGYWHIDVTDVFPHFDDFEEHRVEMRFEMWVQIDAVLSIASVP